MASLKNDKVNFGFGCMRFPRLEDGSIDIEQTKVMVDTFLDAGFCYFDTAYGYKGSEDALRTALVERHPRDSYLIATKLSMDSTCTEEDLHQRIHTSMQRLGVDYIDYYLLHNVSRTNAEICNKFDLWSYAKKLKEDGLVRHYGFSFHDSPEKLEELLTAHPEVDFVQLQINYLDWEDPSVQSGKCYEIAKKHGKMLIVMEPCKGGALANNLPDSAKQIFLNANPDASFASWALRFVASLDGVNVILSGMSTIDQVKDNVSFMGSIVPLSEDEAAVVKEVKQELTKIPLIQCTGCEYCLKNCPMGIRTPFIFRALNRYYTFQNFDTGKEEYDRCTGNGNYASTCIQCGMCEESCPQQLPIRELLVKAAEIFE